MKETVVIELQNEHAYKLLEDLEQMNIINIISREEQRNDDENNSEPNTKKTKQSMENIHQADWYKLSGSQLAKSYSDTEPEYNLSMLKEPNPDYTK